MEIIGAIASILDIGKCVWNFSRHHIGYVTHYRNDKEEFKREADKFFAKVKDIQEEVRECKRKGETITNTAKQWQGESESLVKKMVKIEQDMDKLEVDGKNSRCCCCCLGPGVISRYSLGKRAKTARDKILTGPERPLSYLSKPTQPEIKPAASFKAFESRKVDAETIMRALEDDEVETVAVWGMPGVGKTWAVEKAGHDAQQKGLFDEVVMAVVSRNPVRKVQEKIAKKLDVFVGEDYTEEIIAEMLKMKISTFKKLLVILDDVWHYLDLSKVMGTNIPNCKLKILLTTRRKDVRLSKKIQLTICLQILSDDDSWSLFSRESQVEDCPVAREVARECRGLPLALVTLARSLAGKDKSDWVYALRQLKRSEPALPGNEYEDEVFKFIQISYDFLKPESKLRAFFLLCSLFPEDHNIMEEELARWGMGLGLFSDVCNMEEARENTNQLAKHLKSAGMLLDGDNERSSKMHDVIRDFAIHISTKEHLVKAGLGVERWPGNHSFDNYTKISLMFNNIDRLPDGLNCPALKLLLLQGNRNLKKIPDNFFATMESLKVLDLNRVSILSLPSSIVRLPNLRSLCLDGCRSTDITMLGGLQMLEILSLRKSFIEELPEDIGMLTSLRMLDLTLSKCTRIPPRVLSRLINLEELYMKGSFAKWGANIGGHEASFDELLSLSYLKILEVDVDDVTCIPITVTTTPTWDKFDMCLSNVPFRRLANAESSKHETPYSKVLVLSTPLCELPDWFRRDVAGKANKLLYEECYSLSNILKDYYCQGELPYLKSLSLEQSNNMMHLMTFNDEFPNAPAFKCLEELYVHQLDKMESICCGNLTDGSLKNLKFLEVKQCNALVGVLLPFNLLERMQKLNVIHVTGNTSVESVFGFENRGGLVPELTVMRLEKLFKLTSIWQGPNQIAIFNNLKVVSVKECGKLRYLFPSSTCRRILKLEELRVEECKGLVEIIQNDEENITEMLIFPQLRILSLRSLPCLTSFYDGSNLPECPLLDVQNCPMLNTSFCNPILTSTSNHNGQEFS